MLHYSTLFIVVLSLLQITNNMSIEQKIQAIAEYDGWKFTNDDPETYPNGYWYIGSGVNLRVAQPDLWKYLRSMDWLHPVAVKVKAEIRKIEFDIEPFRLFNHIQICCGSAPVNNEYIDLLNAVYSGIEYLNQKQN